MGDSGRAPFALDLPERLGDRFIDVGICEQTMVGMAAGFALRGRIPVVHALATFLTLRAFEFIRDDVGIAGLPVKLIGGVPRVSVGGERADAPGDRRSGGDARNPRDADLLPRRTRASCWPACPPSWPAPRRPTSASTPRRAAFPHQRRSSWDGPRSLCEGHDLGILAAGLLVPYVREACDVLSGEGINARLVNLRTIAPSMKRRSSRPPPGATWWWSSRIICWWAVSTSSSARFWFVAAIPSGAAVRARRPLVSPRPARRPPRLRRIQRRQACRAAAPRAPEPRQRLASVRGGRRSLRASAFSLEREKHPMTVNRVTFNLDNPSIATSDALYARSAASASPCATQTLAKGAGQHVRRRGAQFLRSRPGPPR